MPRIPRRDLLPAYCIVHVTTRGVNGTRIFRDDRDFAAFVADLVLIALEHRWIVHAACCMSNHLHLVVACRREDLSRGLQRLLGRHARRFNDRHNRYGSLFASRFTSWIVVDDDHLANAVDYVHDNPVGAGLCREAHEWRWSTGSIRPTPAPASAEQAEPAERPLVPEHAMRDAGVRQQLPVREVPLVARAEHRRVRQPRLPAEQLARRSRSTPRSRARSAVVPLGQAARAATSSARRSASVSRGSTGVSREPDPACTISA